MKRMICLLTVFVLCLSLAAPAFATESGFVPSITYKENPEIVPVMGQAGQEYVGVIRDESGEIIDNVVHGCLNITPIAHVWDEEKKVPEDVEKLLTFVYEELNEGEMELPYEKLEAGLDPAHMVIRDLFDARWACTEHKEMVEKEGVTFEITFDLGVVADAQIYVMTYDEEAKDWEPIVKTVNNGDGTVTCTFEHLCAIAFSMPMAPVVAPEEPHSPNILPWIILLILAVVAVVVILIIKNKKKAAV